VKNEKMKKIPLLESKKSKRIFEAYSVPSGDNISERDIISTLKDHEFSTFDELMGFINKNSSKNSAQILELLAKDDVDYYEIPVIKAAMNVLANELIVHIFDGADLSKTKSKLSDFKYIVTVDDESVLMMKINIPFAFYD
jgi:hypothetical protein